MKIKGFLSLLLTERVALILLLTLSVFVNLLLANRLVSARGDLAAYLANRKLTLGGNAPVLTSYDELGNEVSSNFSEGSLPTVLYFQSVSCHWCERNKENVDILISQAPNRFQFISLFLESADKVSLDKISHPNVQKLFSPTVESKISFDLYSSPQTILISPDGKVLKIWKGAYHAQHRADIESSLAVDLPDRSLD